MAKKKKSRKVGKIGVSSVPKAERKRKPALEGKSKNTKGKPAGSRHSAGKQASAGHASAANKDPRLGSKKPIPLVVEPKKHKTQQKTFFSPAQELKSIEDDARLSELLDALDEGQKLNKDDQLFVDAKLARHKVLCELLGVKDEDEDAIPDSDDVSSDDPYERFNTIDINKFK